MSLLLKNNFFRAMVAVLLLMPAVTMSAQSVMTAQDYYEKGKKIWTMQCPEERCTREDVVEAITALKKAVELNPKLVDAYLVLGEFFEWGAYAKMLYPGETAKAYYEKALKLSPERGDVYSHLAYLEEFGSKEHIALLRKALELDPSQDVSRYYFARALILNNKIPEALKEYNIYLEQQPFITGEPGRNHGRFFRDLLKRGHVDDAVRLMEKALDLDTSSRRLEKCLALDMFDTKPYASYPSFVKKVEQLKRYCTGFDHIKLADKLERQGKFDEALVELRRQLEVNPYYFATYNQLERIYIIKNQWEKAWGAMKQYFEFETDVKEKCLKYRYLSVRAYERFDKAYLSELGKTCKKINDALY